MAKSSFAFRLLILTAGLFIFGTGVAMMVRASIGLAPWEVLAQGIGIQTGLTIGQATVVVSVIVMLLWIPLKVKPGLGSVMNALLIGVFADLVLTWLETPQSYLGKLLMFSLGLVVVAFATGMYISAGMGKGPRDGFMVGLAQKFKVPFWRARASVEIAVVGVGFLLGGQVREGTIIFAICIGYLNQLALRLFRLAGRDGRI